MEKYNYRFSFGPWNIHEGADTFGPAVRPSVAFESKLKTLKDLGFDAMQFHDDDVVRDLAGISPARLARQAGEVRKRLDDHGLEAEFVAPRLWEHPLTIDGAFTANDPQARAYAIDRARKAVDIGKVLGTDLMVIWLAREGTYLRESKDAVRATLLLLESLNDLLDYDPELRIAIEPKPNEPMDMAYIPTVGHALALGSQTHAPERVGALVETAHAVLAGLSPADEMSFALSFNKLWGVHLNDQNGMKFDEDRSFGAVNLRRAFNQVRVLEENRYAEAGMVGLDVKALRTQPPELATKHLRNSLAIFLRLVELVRTLDQDRLNSLKADRDYEELDWLILSHLLGD